MLNRFHVEYKPQAAIKGHVLANLFADFFDITAKTALQAPLTKGQKVVPEKPNTLETKPRPP